MADVEPLDPERDLVQAERVAQRLQRPHAVHVRRAEPLLEGEPGVLRHEVEEAAPLPLRRRADAHPSAAPPAEELLDQRPVRRRARQDDLRRRRLLGVELRQHLVVERLRRRRGVEGELPPPDDPPLAHPEQLEHRLVVLAVLGPEVGRPAAADLHPLPRGERAQRGEHVPVARRLLELQPPRGLVHPRLDRRLQLGVAPLEEQPRLAHPLGVGRGVGLPRAGREALVEVVVEAGALLAVEAEVAVRDLEEARDHPQRAPGVARRQERAEVEAAVGAHAPRQRDPRELVAHRELQVRVRLVVPQHHVVARLVLLDQVVLEDQRLELAPGDDEVEVARLGDELGDPRRVLRAGLEVGAHPLAQRTRLADVDDPSLGRPHPVAAGILGDALQRPRDLLRQILAHRAHSSRRAQAAQRALSRRPRRRPRARAAA